MSLVKIRSFFVLCVLFLTNHAFAADTAYVDMHKILNSTGPGITAQEILSKFVRNIQNEINIKQDNLRTLKSEASVDNTKKEKFDSQLVVFQKYTKTAQANLQKLDEEYTRFILEGITSTCREFQLQSHHVSICALVKESGQLNCDDGLIAGRKNNATINESEDITEKIAKLFTKKQEYINVIKNSESTEITRTLSALHDSNLNKQSIQSPLPVNDMAK